MRSTPGSGSGARGTSSGPPAPAAPPRAGAPARPARSTSAATARRHGRIGVLSGWFGQKIEGDSWFRCGLFHLPVPSMWPQRMPMRRLFAARQRLAPGDRHAKWFLVKSAGTGSVRGVYVCLCVCF